MSTEYHFPGQSYTGPGTHVVTRILNNDIISNKTDFVTLLHDIEYMGGVKPYRSDMRAIRNSDWSLPGIATKLGLGSRIILDAIPGISVKFNEDKGLSMVLMDYLLNSAYYAPMFKKYEINPMNYLVTRPKHSLW